MGTLGTVFPDPSRGFAPAPPVWSLGTVFADPKYRSEFRSKAPLRGYEGKAYAILGSAKTVPRVPTGVADAKALLGSVNTVQCQARC